MDPANNGPQRRTANERGESTSRPRERQKGRRTENKMLQQSRANRAFREAAPEIVTVCVDIRNQQSIVRNMKTETAAVTRETTQK
jgi:hypothetical protein